MSVSHKSNVVIRDEPAQRNATGMNAERSQDTDNTGSREQRVIMREPKSCEAFVPGIFRGATWNYFFINLDTELVWLVDGKPKGWSM
jgi:hypothetical protein